MWVIMKVSWLLPFKDDVHVTTYIDCYGNPISFLVEHIEWFLFEELSVYFLLVDIESSIGDATFILLA